MKQLELTPSIIAKLKRAVGEDVDVSNFAVFEAIALNTHPLPGKDGTIFEKARASFSTLTAMAEQLQNGQHIPLVADHNLEGAPKGRVFHGEVLGDPNGEVELRVLFFLDQTESQTIAKLNSGSLDEVSVAFVAEKLLCSNCTFDFSAAIAAGDFSCAINRQCPDGHAIGTEGVHLRMVGLSKFYEISVVSIGAAKDPKIVGKSASRLSPQLQRLAASGIQIDALTCSASKGVHRVDPTEFIAKLEAKTTEVVTLNASVAQLTAERDALLAKSEATQAELIDLKEKLTAAQEAVKPSEDAAALASAIEFLTGQFVAVAAAAGKDIEAPKTVAELVAGIQENHTALSKILPIGGAANASTSKPEVSNSPPASVFKVNKR